jgi:flagellar hook-associated protein 3 FlgL
MRITQAMISRNALYRLNQNRNNMNAVQERIFTGRKVNRASDDPTLYARADRIKDTLNQNEQYLSKIQYSRNWLDNSVSLLENLNDIVIQARDVANKGADGQSNAEIRTTLAGHLDALLNESLDIVNSQYLGKSVFAGTATKTVNPFVNTGGVISYNGNDDAITRSYSENINVTINMTGQDIMDTGIFTSMTDLYDALIANDETAIRAEIDNLKTASSSLLGLTSEMGARSKNIDLIQSRLEQATLDLEGFLSDTRDSSLDEEIVKYQAEEFAYQAALQATSNSIKLNILQFL